MPRVYMNFQFYQDWTVHFLEDDLKTPLGSFFHYPGLEGVRKILIRAHATPEIFRDFETQVKAWNKGGLYLNLTVEQYKKLKKV
jgi:hypothetical protein